MVVIYCYLERENTLKLIRGNKVFLSSSKDLCYNFIMMTRQKLSRFSQTIQPNILLTFCYFHRKQKPVHSQQQTSYNNMPLSLVLRRYLSITFKRVNPIKHSPVQSEQQIH